MGFLENLTNEAFANKMAEHYQAQVFPAAPSMPHATDGLSPDKKADYFHTHIGAAPFKSIRAESGDNPQTPAWGAQPYLERGMRGGISQLTAPAFDSIRIGGFMASPKGLLFIAKQVGLQRSNPKGEYLTPGVSPGRRYNAASTLAQVLLGPLGIHIDRHGKGSLNIEADNYESRIKVLNKLPTIGPNKLPTSNRLVSIASQLEVGYHRKLDLISSEVFTLNYVESLEQKKTSRNNKSNKARFEGPIIINAMSGIGGPNSLFGLGDTFHKAYVRNLPEFTATYYKPPSKALPVGDPGTDSYTGLKGIEGDYKGLAEHDNFSPFKKKDLAGSSDSPLAKYQTLNYGGIVKAGKATSTNTPLKSFSTEGGEGTRYGNRDSAYARIGLIDYGKGDRYGDSYGESGDPESEGSDFVTLKLKRGSDILKFRSYGLGSITDNTSFSWSEVKYVGRTMAQHKFDSVARDVSHDLTIVAFSALELEMNYTKLNELYQMASPSVDATTGLATAPFCKLTLGDLYVNQNVIIDKITFTVDEATSWDINYGESQVETAGAELPMVVKLNLGYKLITNAKGEFFSKSSNYWDPQF
jgi:hypothetical protein